MKLVGQRAGVTAAVCMNIQTLIEAARCAMPRGPGWYVFAVESGTPRELNDGEEGVVNKFRFGMTPIT